MNRGYRYYVSLVTGQGFFTNFEEGEPIRMPNGDVASPTILASMTPDAEPSSFALNEAQIAYMRVLRTEEPSGV